MMRVSLSEFIRATGRDPAHDDMERVNCMEAGTIGHLCCGWNAEHNKPQFEVGPVEWNGKFPRNSVQK
jgi:hypothetical protein